MLHCLRRCVYLLCAAAFLMLPAPEAIADTEYMVSEETIADLILTEEHTRYILPAIIPGEPARPRSEGRKWAVLPLIGYGPETGPLGGVEFCHRDIFGSGVSVDVNGLYGLEGQQSFGLSVGSPHFAKSRLLLVLRGRFLVDVGRPFFGLGMNEVGSEPLSREDIQDAAGSVTVGWRAFENIAFNFTLGVRNVQLWCPSVGDSVPCTTSEFPDLPGVEGGWVNYLGLSVVWDNSDSIVRPTRGWRFIVKAIHTNNLLVGPYEFTRFVGDGSHLMSFFEKRLILGIRVNGELIVGPEKQIPFWELSELGGRETLRGFLPYRFVGTSRFLVNGEARYALTEFDFIHRWHIRIDGVVFGDAGRVFIDENALSSEFGLNQEIINRQTSGFQFSYGFGTRIAIGQAILARIDVGFSEEETGLVYLSFGQMF
jgi:outer membrane protein assembly factor BamA